MNEHVERKTPEIINEDTHSKVGIAIPENFPEESLSIEQTVFKNPDYFFTKYSIEDQISFTEKALAKSDMYSIDPLADVIMHQSLFKNDRDNIKKIFVDYLSDHSELYTFSNYDMGVKRKKEITSVDELADMISRDVKGYLHAVSQVEEPEKQRKLLQILVDQNGVSLTLEGIRVLLREDILTVEERARAESIGSRMLGREKNEEGIDLTSLII